MAFRRGPNIVRDGLVFGYDADDRCSRFYKGEPTTNLINISNWNNQTGWNTQQHTAILTTDLLFPGVNVLKAQYLSSDGTHSSYSDLSVSTSTGLKYAFSFWVKSPYTNTYVYAHDGSGSGIVIGSFITIPNQWQKLTGVFTTVSNSGIIRIHVNQNTPPTENQIIYITAPQVELKDHPTQFTPTSRSSTQSLVDLTSRNYLDLSNVSFDNTAHPKWIGANYIDKSISINPNSGFSIEIWIKLLLDPHTLTSFMPIVHLEQALYGMLMEPGDIGITLDAMKSDDTRISARFANSNIEQNQWNHLVFTWNNGTFKMYKNNILLGTDTTIGPYDAHQISVIRIGSIFGLDNQNYLLPVFRFYNKTLTQTEVDQNFNSNKNRFNL